MVKKCKQKVRYGKYEVALENADRYMSDIPLTFSYMVPYYCEQHSCYHVGHNNVKRKYEVNLLEIIPNVISYNRSASND